MNIIRCIRGQAAVETALVLSLFATVFIATVEVVMLCARGELLLGAAARASRLAAVYNTTPAADPDPADIEAHAVLPWSHIGDDARGNRIRRVMHASYEPRPVTRLWFFGDAREVALAIDAIPSLPEDLPDAALGGDNPLPYCIDGEDLRPCDPSEAI